MTTFFGGAPINRLSFLRPNKEFISKVCEYPATRLIFYRKDAVRSDYRVLVNQADNRIWYLRLDQDKDVAKLVQDWAAMNSSASIHIRDQLTGVFLGMDENPGTQGSPIDESLKLTYGEHSGVPLLAFDITKSQSLLDKFESSSRVTFLSQMADILALTPIDAAIYSYGKMYMDWLGKYQFCPGCGHTMIPLDAGTRMQCTNEDKHEDTFDCPVRRTKVNNVCYPRTDPVVIIALKNAKGTKLLLGHNKRRKSADGKFFSCFSGFMEPGETIEGAVTREVWEETGLRLKDNVRIIKSQPWPFPCCLMIGCIGVVTDDSDDAIRLDLDEELDVCEWFSVDYVSDLVYGRPTDGHIKLPQSGSVAFELIKMTVEECQSRL